MPEIDVLRFAQRQAYQHFTSASAPAGRATASASWADLSLSRMPVHEAILQLAAERLVTLWRNRSAEVTELSPAETLEVFEMRAVPKGLAVCPAVARLDADVENTPFLILRRLQRRARRSTSSFSGKTTFTVWPAR